MLTGPLGGGRVGQVGGAGGSGAALCPRHQVAVLVDDVGAAEGGGAETGGQRRSQEATWEGEGRARAGATTAGNTRGREMGRLQKGAGPRLRRKGDDGCHRVRVCEGGRGGGITRQNWK